MSSIGSTLIGLALGLGASAVPADVVAVVSANGPVVPLSNNQVVDIFLGKTSRFPDGRLALPIDQDEGSDARDEFYATFAGKSPAQVKAHWSKIIFTGRGQPPLAVANGNEVKKHVAATPNSIGYIERTQLDGSVKVLQNP
jgi:ABC-type phosphate transport system substrate-binding protein